MFRDINVIARVANSTRKIDIPQLRQFCKDAYIFKIKAFDWPSLTTSLHRAYAHLPDIILLNDGLGLGDVSETCLESSHKILRYASKHLARQNNNLNNAYDCYMHLWFISDPIVRSELEKSEPESASKEVVKDGDDPLVESFFED